MNHANIVILTPGHSLMAGYVKSLLNTAQVLERSGLTWAFSNDYASHVADAREITLSGTKDNNIFDSRPLGGALTYDKLLWIDSDISWKPEDVLKLYYSDKDVISGAYILGNNTVAAYPTMFGPPLTQEYVLGLKEEIEIEGAGFGFLCFRAGIFENLSRPWFQMVPKSHTINGVEVDVPIMGEDLSLCQRVREIGFKIWLDPSVRVDHHKTLKLTWNGVQS